MDVQEGQKSPLSKNKQPLMLFSSRHRGIILTVGN